VRASRSTTAERHAVQIRNLQHTVALDGHCSGAMQELRKQPANERPALESPRAPRIMLMLADHVRPSSIAERLASSRNPTVSLLHGRT
jgi:hypothetical protein